jgi:hypothetical protein
MRQGDRMPWYPSARLLRQPRVGQWDSLIERVAARLADFAEGRLAAEAPG